MPIVKNKIYLFLLQILIKFIIKIIKIIKIIEIIEIIEIFI